MKNKVCATGVKKMTFKKYAKGTKGIFNKDRVASSDADAYATDAGDAILSQVKMQNNASNVTPNENNTSDNSFVGPANQPAEQNSRMKAIELNAAPKTRGNDAKLAAWQAKRGLKADGIWGAESKKAYAAEQAAKASKNFQKPVKDNRQFEGPNYNTEGYKKPSNTDFYQNKQHQAIMESGRGRAAQVGTDSQGQALPTVVKRNSITEKRNKPAPSVVGYSRDVNQRYADGSMPKRYDSMGGEISKPTMSPKLKKGWTPPTQKFAEGTSGISTKKNMFQKLKDKQNASDANANAIDAEDNPVKVTQEKSFVGPKSAVLEGRDAEANYDREQATKKARTEGEAARTELESGKKAAVKSTVPTGKTEGVDWNNKAEMAKVAAYQTRHGLKADGVWGKDTAKFYADSQKAKANSSAGSTRGTAIQKKIQPLINSTKSITKDSKVPTNLNTGKGLSYKEYQKDDDSIVRMASNGDQYYENGRVRRKNGKMENARPDELANATRTFYDDNKKKDTNAVAPWIREKINQGADLVAGKRDKNGVRKREDGYLDNVIELGIRGTTDLAGATVGGMLGGKAGGIGGGIAGDAAGKKLSSKILNSLGYEKENGDYTRGEAVLAGAMGGLSPAITKVGGKVLSKVAPKLLGGAESAIGKQLVKHVPSYAKAITTNAERATAKEAAKGVVKEGEKGLLSKAKGLIDKATGKTAKATTAAEAKALAEAEELAATQSSAGTKTAPAKVSKNAYATKAADKKSFSHVQGDEVTHQQAAGNYHTITKTKGGKYYTINNKTGKIESPEKAKEIWNKYGKKAPAAKAETAGEEVLTADGGKATVLGGEAKAPAAEVPKVTKPKLSSKEKKAAEAAEKLKKSGKKISVDDEAKATTGKDAAADGGHVEYKVGDINPASGIPFKSKRAIERYLEGGSNPT